MNLLKQNRQHIMIISTGLTVAASLILLGFIAYPSIREIMNLSDRIYQERVDLEKLYRKGQILKQTLKDYQTIKPTLNQFTNIYVIPGNELDFITHLEKVATEQKVNQDITLGLADKKPKVNKLPIQLHIDSSLANFVKYLTGLEQLDYYLNIETLRLGGYNKRTSPGSANNFTLSAFLLGSAYYKP